MNKPSIWNRSAYKFQPMRKPFPIQKARAGPEGITNYNSLNSRGVWSWSFDVPTMRATPEGRGKGLANATRCFCLGGSDTAIDAKDLMRMTEK